MRVFITKIYYNFYVNSENQIQDERVERFMVRKLDEQRASDFYCYCFEEDRIYKRFNIFRGECNIRSFQFLILDSLFREWIRRPDVEAAIYPLQGSRETNEPTVEEDIRKDPLLTLNEKTEEKEELRRLEAVIKKLDEEDRIYLKSLSFSGIDIEPEDIRTISRISGRNLQETLEIITELEESLSKRYERYKKKRKELNKINLLPENIEINISKNLIPAHAFREGMEDKEECLSIEQKRENINIKVELVRGEGINVSMNVLVIKDELPLKKARITLYMDKLLLLSRNTADNGRAEFPNITLGDYTIKIPKEDLEMRLRILPLDT